MFGLHKKYLIEIQSKINWNFSWRGMWAGQVFVFGDLPKARAGGVRSRTVLQLQRHRYGGMRWKLTMVDHGRPKPRLNLDLLHTRSSTYKVCWRLNVTLGRTPSSQPNTGWSMRSNATTATWLSVVGQAEQVELNVGIWPKWPHCCVLITAERLD